MYKKNNIGNGIYSSMIILRELPMSNLSNEELLRIDQGELGD